MSDAQVRIVTDGGVSLTSETIRDLNISIVPCLCKMGKQTVESSAEMPLPAVCQKAGGKEFETEPPLLGRFLDAYRALGDAPAISIHSAHSLSKVGHVARLAHAMVTPRRNVKLFEARTVDLGVTFLVEAAAQAAQEGMGQEQIVLLLRRLEDEKLSTLILTSDVSGMEKRLRLDGSLSRLTRFLPMMQHLVMVDKTQGDLVLRAQGLGLANGLAKQQDVFAAISPPTALWMRQHGFDGLMPTVQNQLTALLQVQAWRVEKGAAGCPHLRGRYMELIVLPTPETVTQIKSFVRRMWRAFGPASAAMSMKQ